MSQGAYIKTDNMDLVYGYSGFLYCFLKIERKLRELVEFTDQHRRFDLILTAFQIRILQIVKLIIGKTLKKK